MKKLPCSGSGCSNRRKHYESMDPRGIIYVEVPDEYEGKAFCSIECRVYYNAAQTVSDNSHNSNQ